MLASASDSHESHVQVTLGTRINRDARPDTMSKQDDDHHEKDEQSQVSHLLSLMSLSPSLSSPLPPSGILLKHDNKTP